MGKGASILVVSGDLSSDNAADCLASLKAGTPPELVREVIIIEAGVRPDFNHAAEINRALRIFSGDCLVLLDDDVVLGRGCLEGLLSCAEQCENAGIVGAVLTDRRGRIISSGGDVTDTCFGVDQKEPVVKPEERKYVTSAVMLITRKAAETVGPFDERFRKYGLDADYCFRAWEAGFRVLVSPGARAVHRVGRTVDLRLDKKELFERDREYFYAKWRQSRIYSRFEVIDLTRRGTASFARAGENRERPSLKGMMRAADELRNRYGLAYVDIAGGERGECGPLCELAAYCRSIGLLPAVVTDGQSPEAAAEVIAAGVEDFVILVPVRQEAAVRSRIESTVALLKEKKIGFRTGTVLCGPDCRDLPALAASLAAMGPRIAHLTFPGPRGTVSPPEGGCPWTYAAAAPFVKEAVDRLAAAGVWTNVRHFPLCLLRGYEQHVCNVHQQPWDPYEGDLLPGFGFNKRELKGVRRRADREKLYGIFPAERIRLWLVKHRVCRGNVFPGQCARCADRAICDGVHPQYAARCGPGEFVPREGEALRDPLYYRKKDQAWRMMKQGPVSAGTP